MTARKNNYLYTPLFFTTFLLIAGCQSTATVSKPAFDQQLLPSEKTTSFYQNRQGYWEAALADEHVFVHIPAGTFMMGSEQGEAKEKPVHKFYLDEYWISKYPTTVAQFRNFVETTGYVTDAEKGEGCWIEEGGDIRYDVSWRQPNFKQGNNHPVICVSWNDASAYVKWLSAKTGLNFQLPTEAQWEKAARGTDQRIWPWGNQPPDGTQANFADNNYVKRFGSEGRNVDTSINDGYTQTSPVDAFPKGQSPYGVYDMAGNAIDWLYDWYDASYYSLAEEANPIGVFREPIRKKSASLEVGQITCSAQFAAVPGLMPLVYLASKKEDTVFAPICAKEQISIVPMITWGFVW